MERREYLALMSVVLVLVGLPVAALGYQFGLRPQLSETTVVDIAAVIPEDGGFQPGFVEVAVGEPVTLRFSAEDVTHGIAIGPGLDIDLGHIDPGKVKEITVTFDKPGVYTYYCNTWCSPNHWRMRGTIQVVDPNNPGALTAPVTDPVIQALVEEGVDIDMVHMDHEPQYAVTTRPSTVRGETLVAALNVPAEVETLDWRRTHTPEDAMILLSQANPATDLDTLADVVAYLWRGETSEAAESLYNKNCAACHGQYGAGDGPAADSTIEDPIVFADPEYMFGVRSDVLYAKIRRGGMGTDMPNFGTVLTPDETWMLVEYLWTFPFAETDAESS